MELGRTETSVYSSTNWRPIIQMPEPREDILIQTSDNLILTYTLDNTHYILMTLECVHCLATSILTTIISQSNPGKYDGIK